VPILTVPTVYSGSYPRAHTDVLLRPDLADYKKFTRRFGVILSISDFTRIFWERREGGSPKIPKAIELAFTEPRDEFEAQVKQMIDEAREAEQARIHERIAIQQEKIAFCAVLQRMSGNDPSHALSLNVRYGSEADISTNPNRSGPTPA